MQPNSTEQLAELIAKRLACLQQLRAIGQKQAELIAASEISTLLRLISAKQELIVALQAIEQRLAPYHEQDPEARHWRSSSARNACAQQAEECRQLLQEVMTLEKANEQQMTLRRNEVESRLQTATNAYKARSAYQVHKGHTPAPSRANPAALDDYHRTASLDLSTDS